MGGISVDNVVAGCDAVFARSQNQQGELTDRDERRETLGLRANAPNRRAVMSAEGVPSRCGGMTRSRQDNWRPLLTVSVSTGWRRFVTGDGGDSAGTSATSALMKRTS
ncbi:hypothetical protein [Streptomyces fradiae]|uniref:hypothetical protein n=1 Tax=Streptomyces fradiae TaxID=1906 RepID=UPI003987833F